MENKNISQRIQETQTKVAGIFYNAGLPASVLQLIMKDLYNQITVVAQQELAQQSTPQGEEVDLGEGIKKRNPDDYDYDNNYTPEHAKK